MDKLKKILIVDSGATKTHWALVNGEEKIIQTSGLNPRLLSDEEIEFIVSRELIEQIDAKTVGEIYFYGSGCGSPLMAKRLMHSLKKFFPDASIVVKSDLFGAAKAVLGDGKGLVCILGTGSSAAFFNGADIVNQMPSLGYPLGDEGSGSYIGKILFKSYYNREMPEDLRQILEKKFNLNIDKVLKTLRKSARSKKLMSEIAKYMGEYRDHPFIKIKVRSGLEDFLKEILIYFKKDELREGVGFVGSVGNIYEPMVKEVFEGVGIQVKENKKEPIKNLILYHKKMNLKSRVE